MEVEANEEVQKWAAEECISDLLPTLSKHHYITMQAVRYINEDLIKKMGLSLGGDIIRLLVAVCNANKTACEPLDPLVLNALAPSPQRLPSAHELRKVHETIKELQSNIKTLSIKDRSDRSTPSMFAKRYARLHVACTLEAWFQVAQHPPICGDKPLFPKKGYPEAGEDESRGVQPYWLKKLKKLSNKEGLAVDLKDTHRQVSFGNRKLDVVGYLTKKPKSIFHIALVGDVKARRQELKDNFDAAEKGHLESFLEELLLEFQPYRRAVTGFLTDGCLIQFFRLEKLYASSAELKWTEGPVLYLHDEGGKWLLGFLEDKRVQHELQANIVINKKPVVVDQLLGVGGSSVVYRGSYEDAEVVVKRFHSKHKLHHLRQEATTLRKIARVQFASRVAHLSRPMAKRLVATANDFCQLVDILQEAHIQHAVVHRDVRLPNFFRHPESGLIFLNDWGCATDVGISVYFSGALQHAPRRVLESRIRRRTYSPRFSDDLEMVVRSVFHSLSMTTFEDIRLEEDEATIISFWEHHLAPPVWADMLTAAQEEEYENLKTHIRRVLPEASWCAIP